VRHIHTHIYVQTYIYVYMYLYVSICIYMYTHTNIYIYIYIYTEKGAGIYPACTISALPTLGYLCVIRRVSGGLRVGEHSEKKIRCDNNL